MYHVTCNRDKILTVIILVFCAMGFMFHVVVAQDDEVSVPRPKEYEENLNELLAPITDTVTNSPEAAKGFVKLLLEIDFSSIWDGIKNGYEFVSSKFEDITGLPFGDALKWLGGFMVTVLELFVKFIKWLLSFINN